MNNEVSTRDFNSIDKEHNTKMLLEVPGLKNTVSPTIANQIFFPKQQHISDDEMKGFKNNFIVDENNYIHTEVEIDNKIYVLHHHISSLKEKDETYYTYDATIFNIDGIKIIFQNKIPLCFKQSVVLLALHKKDPSILSIAFEKEELVEVIGCYYNTLKLSYGVDK